MIKKEIIKYYKVLLVSSNIIIACVFLMLAILIIITSACWNIQFRAFLDRKLRSSSNSEKKLTRNGYKLISLLGFVKGFPGMFKNDSTVNISCNIFGFTDSSANFSSFR